MVMEVDLQEEGLEGGESQEVVQAAKECWLEEDQEAMECLEADLLAMVYQQEGWASVLFLVVQLSLQQKEKEFRLWRWEVEQWALGEEPLPS